MCPTRPNPATASIWWMPVLVLFFYGFTLVLAAAWLQHRPSIYWTTAAPLLSPSLMLLFVALFNLSKPAPFKFPSVTRMVWSVVTGASLWVIVIATGGSHGGAWTWPMLIGTCALTPLAEEWFFRGYLFPCLAERFGSMVGLTCTSILFGLFHTSSLTHLLLAVVAGAAFNLLNWSNRGIWPSLLAHFTYNALMYLV